MTAIKIHVKQCMISSDRTACFEAKEGDVVLLSMGDCRYFEATIRSVKSADTVVVAFMDGTAEVEKEIPASEVAALMRCD